LKKSGIPLTGTKKWLQSCKGISMCRDAVPGTRVKIIRPCRDPKAPAITRKGCSGQPIRERRWMIILLIEPMKTWRELRQLLSVGNLLRSWDKENRKFLKDYLT
jgi:hypothetical protein